MAMSDDIRNEIRAELAGLRADLIDRVGSRAGSEWSAHANWKNSKLEFDYSVQSRLVVPPDKAIAPQLEKLMNEGTSERLLSVTRSLSESMK